MPVQIDEITAQVDPAPAAQTPAPTNSPAPASLETELRRQRELLARLEVRAARVAAD
jgi:hypothetical protein